MSKCSNITQYPQVILLSRKQKKSARDKRLPDEERLESLVRDRLYDVDYLLVPRDKPKAHAALGWRVIVIVIAWVVLAWRVEPGTGYFVSLFLFATPLIVDYTSFEPDDRLRKWCQRGYWSSYCLGIHRFHGRSWTVRHRESRRWIFDLH